MENQRVFLRPVFLLLAAFSSALAQNQQVYVAVDDKITLHLSPPASAEITRLVWKHGSNLVGDWTGGEFSFFGTFKGRTTIDPTSGSLEIKNATKSDPGSYEVEVNNVIQTLRYDVRVIRKVLKPSILSVPCPPSAVQCTLVCEAKTDESEPVTYSWTGKDGDWKKENFLDIGNGTESIKTFTCWIRNPVSEEMSKPKENPFFKKPLVPENSGNVGLGVGLGVLVVVVVAAAAGVVVAYRKRDPIMRYISRRTGHGGGSNGDGQKEPDPESREQTPLTKSAEQHPPSDPNSDGPRPPSDPNSDGPRPPSDPNSDGPRPPSGPKDDGPRPPSDAKDDGPRPPSDAKDDGPRPPSDAKDDGSRPPSDPNEEPEFSEKL